MKSTLEDDDLATAEAVRVDSLVEHNNLQPPGMGEMRFLPGGRFVFDPTKGEEHAVGRDGRRYPDAWITTFTGRPFWPLEPDIEDLDIRDVAHALSNKCRFTGHPRVFFSVAEHAINVSRILPPEIALEGLMHDVGETYGPDVAAPIKFAVPVLNQAEESILLLASRKWNFAWPMPPAVKEADKIMLATERRDLFPHVRQSMWKIDALPVPVNVEGYPPHIAERLFLKTFEHLSEARRLATKLYGEDEDG